MKKVNQTMLGVAAFIAMPDSIEEFNSFLVGRPETALDYANAEAYYRGIAPKVRSKFLTSVQEATSVAPKVVSTKTVGDKTVDIYEKDTVYMKRVVASGVGPDVLVPLLQEAFDAVGWDLTSTRSSGPNAKDREVVDFILNAIAAGESTFDRVVGNYERLNPGLEIAREDDDTVTPEALAEAVRIDRLRRENESKVSML